MKSEANIRLNVWLRTSSPSKCFTFRNGRHDRPWGGNPDRGHKNISSDDWRKGSGVTAEEISSASPRCMGKGKDLIDSSGKSSCGAIIINDGKKQKEELSKVVEESGDPIEMDGDIINDLVDSNIIGKPSVGETNSNGPAQMDSQAFGPFLTNKTANVLDRSAEITKFNFKTHSSRKWKRIACGSSNAESRLEDRGNARSINLRENYESETSVIRKRDGVIQRSDVREEGKRRKQRKQKRWIMETVIWVVRLWSRLWTVIHWCQDWKRRSKAWLGGRYFKCEV
ncbi:hypothetical protein QYF36_020891 [Acer negundo]|nr:hypothetical protein QYF36_020891 [Acer negundo]